MAQQIVYAEQFQSRMVSGSGNDQVGKIVLKITKGAAPSGVLTVPKLSQTWPNREGLDRYELYFNYYTVDPGIQYDTYTYHYSKIKDGYLRSVLKGSLSNTPLKEKTGYKTAWEYVLATYETAKAGTVPSWYSTKTDATVDDEDYKWIQNPGNIPQDLQPVTGGDELWKNGVRTYRNYSIIVSETTYFEKEEDADTLASLVGFLSAPQNKHGFAEDSIHWLVTSTNTSYEGSYFLAQVTYEYKYYLDKDNNPAGWDQDLY